MKNRPTYVTLAVVLSLTTLGHAQTQVADLIMYGVDGDTNQLLHYNFSTDVFTFVGLLTDQIGDVIQDTESMAFIPTGPHRGFYTSGNWDALAQHETVLIKLDAFDASGYAYPAPNGLGYILGMVAYEKPTGDWVLYATARTNGGTRRLIEIDPATGLSTLIITTTHKYFGLASDSNGVLYGMTYDDLWIIDPVAGTETLVGAHGWPRTEALEFAFGDSTAAVDISGVDPTWTSGGALFSFSDNVDALLVINPADGSAVEYVCAFDTVDCEGFVFFTTATDPIGAVVVNPRD